MSWWDSAGFSNLASQALKTAQSKIDKVLDIKDDEVDTANNEVESQKLVEKKTNVVSTEDDSWNNWMGSDGLGFESVSSPFFAKSLGEKMSTKPKKSKSQEKANKTLSLKRQNSLKKNVDKVASVEESATQNLPKSSELKCAELTVPETRQKQATESKTTKSPSESTSKKGKPLKLGSSLSKTKVDSTKTNGEDVQKKEVEEMLRREKEAEQKMMEMLGADVKFSSDQSKKKPAQSVDEPKDTNFDEQQVTVTTPSRLEMKMTASTASIQSSDWQDATLLTVSQIDSSDPSIMTESQVENWAEADLLTESQIVETESYIVTEQTREASSSFTVEDSKQDESIKAAADTTNILTEEQKYNDEANKEEFKNKEDSNKSDLVKECHKDSVDNIIGVVDDVVENKNEIEKAAATDSDEVIHKETHDSERIQVTAEDSTTAERHSQVEKNDKCRGANTEDKSCGDDESQTSITIPDSVTVSNETDNLVGSVQDANSVISTLEGSLSSETVDDLSSSNQTLTADDFQSSVTSSKSSDKETEVEDYTLSTKVLFDFKNSDSKQSDSSTIIGDNALDSDVVNAVKADDLPQVHLSSDTTPAEKQDDDAQEAVKEEKDSAESDSMLVSTDFSQSPSTDKIQQSESSESSPGQTQQISTSMIASHSSQCSTSSFVKNMIEEAMAESVKDLDSRSDSVSHSSSDMVRIESDQNTSGHTSGDDLETAASSITSSDIEIISHISTPNGENRGFGGFIIDRPFDLSPLRQAINKAVIKSPSGHRRSDSGSSAVSLHSKNGEEIQYVIHYERERPKEETNDPYEKEKLLKEASQPPTPTTLQPIKESTEASTSDQSNLDVDKLLEKLAEKAELLEAREKKLVDLSRQNMDLLEDNTILRNQLEQSEEARESEMTDLNVLTEEFTKRLSDSEKRLNAAAKECDMLRKKLQDTELALVKRSNSSVTTEKLMKEKDQQISELLSEGEKLSKQQLQTSNLLKKLRAKEKESDSVLKSQREKIEGQHTEIERLQKVLDNKCDVEKKQNESINQLQSLIKRQEKELEKYKTEWEEAQEKVRSTQATLDKSFKEIADLHKANVTKATEKQEAMLSSEIQAKQELQMQLDRIRMQHKQEQEALVFQIEDLRLSMTRQEKENGRREDVLRQEISDLQQRLQESERRNQELSSNVTAATRPLLRQIENLQSTYTAQASSYEKTEKNLTDRLSEAQKQLATAQEKERVVRERLLDFEARFTTLEAQLTSLREDKARLEAKLEMEKTKVQVLEDSKNKESEQRETLQHSLESRLSELKKEKLLLENQLEMEKMKVEAEKKKLLLAHEQIRDKELQLSQSNNTSSISRSSTPRNSVIENENSIITSMNASMANSFLSQTGDDLERSFVFTPKSSTASLSNQAANVSLYDSMRNSGAAAFMENLQSQLKMKDGEISQLQNEIRELEHTRESMAKELVTLSNTNEELEERVKQLPETIQKYKELDQRYQAILQMYGEKTEEAQELRLDLQDIKDMYRVQIEQLLQKS